jgi:hypothetical protein
MTSKQASTLLVMQRLNACITQAPEHVMPIDNLEKMCRACACKVMCHASCMSDCAKWSAYLQQLLLFVGGIEAQG